MKKSESRTESTKQVKLLKKHFPSCFDRDGAFMPEKLQDIIKQVGTDISTESYSLNWLGKSYARLLANEGPQTMLRADDAHNDKPENKSSKNLLIKGDNLEVLKHLVGAYSEKVKMIYIDPPYNTGSDGFVYADNRKFTPEELSRLAGITEKEAQRILDFTQKGSNSHSAWLTFMYPRLVVARELLRDDGVIFISIDDNEAANLKLLCDEVFGGENFVSEFVWKSKSGGANDSGSVAVDHEYVFCYSKNIDSLPLGLDPNGVSSTSYSHKDEKGRYALERLDKQNLQYSASLDYEIEGPDGVVYRLNHKNPKRPNAIWRWSRDRVKKEFSSLVFKDGNVYTKNYEKIGLKPRSLLVDDRFGRTRTGSADYSKVIGEISFNNPKPVKLLNFLLNIGSCSESIVLDFFAGSGTTAQALMEINLEDGGNRKYICVQIPEKLDKKSEAYKAGFETIFDITKTRIERVAEKVRNENPNTAHDFGFKIFEIRPYPDGYLDEAPELTPDLSLFSVDNLSDQDSLDLLRTWASRDGVELSDALEPIDLAGYTAHLAGKEKHRLYFVHSNLDLNVVISLLKKIDEDKDFAPRHLVVCAHSLTDKEHLELKRAIGQFNRNNQKEMKLTLEVRFQ